MLLIALLPKYMTNEASGNKRTTAGYFIARVFYHIVNGTFEKKWMAIGYFITRVLSHIN